MSFSPPFYAPFRVPAFLLRFHRSHAGIIALPHHDNELVKLNMNLEVCRASGKRKKTRSNATMMTEIKYLDEKFDMFAIDFDLEGGNGYGGQLVGFM
ncbi:hypothetical protein Trydic_g6306 [Trypoxylus dichotomus]